MDKIKFFKKGLIALSAIIPLLSIYGSNLKSIAATDCTKVDESNVKFVNATFVDIDAEQYNAQLRGISQNDYYNMLYDERAEYDEKGLYFGMTEDRVAGGLQNGYTGPHRYLQANGVLQGLVENKLVNGNLKVVDKYKNGTSLFPNISAPNSVYTKVLNNYKMPFLKQENGYYSFNSDEYHLKLDENNKKFELHKGARGGFYPFNKCEDDTSVDANKDLFFTVKMEIPFYMTTDGKVKNSLTGEYEDMVFNFSGDDDVWVFIDDTLVLDLGGLHIKQTGNINFAKNEVYYSTVYNERMFTDDYFVYLKAFPEGKLAQGEHTLKLFYMERAGGISNLFATFNLQSSGVETRYVEKYSGKELDKTLKTGAVGDVIELEEKQFEDKVLCERPSVTQATLQEDLQTFYFYYKNKYNLTTDYLDFYDKSKIAPSNNAKVVEDEKYTTENKEINDYTLVEVPSNATGIMPHEDVSVKYYYKYNKAKVTVKYVDKTTNQVMDQETLTGTEGEKVVSEEKSFDDYVLVEKPADTTFSKKDQEITYYYKHKGKITVNYIDKANNSILNKEELKGIEGDEVESIQKSFDNYIFFSGPESNKHTITREEQTVNYYYIHQSKIIVNYIDRDTNESLDRIEDTVTEGTVYTTQEKEFKYYKLVEKPKSPKVLIGKKDIEINYYYQKLKFNLKVEMNLKQASINGNYHELKNKIGKVEVNLDEANANSTSKIHYIIKVTNDQEREGNGVLVDYLPSGYMALQDDNPLWTIASDRAYINIDNINPNETLEFELILTKKEGIELCQTINNKVEVKSIDIEETNLEDNADKNDVVIMPRTGKKGIAIIVGCLVTMLSVIAIKIRKILKK